MIIVDILTGLIGGLMIGTAGAILLLGAGRIMGASGILGGLLSRTSGDATRERLFFVGGLVAMPALLALFMPVATQTTQDIGLLILGGLAVGIGTRMANGCTSGHGVCGISRFSLRGVTATLVYIGAGIATVTLLRLTMGA